MILVPKYAAVLFISTLYRNYIEVKNESSKIVSIQCFCMSPDMFSKLFLNYA